MTRLIMLWVFFLVAIAPLVYQIYTYLQTGTWIPISLITAFQWLGAEWAITPNSWHGLYEVLDFIPLSLTIFVLGVITAFDFDE